MQYAARCRAGRCRRFLADRHHDRQHLSGDEAFYAAEKLKAEWGDHVITDTYPDEFASKAEVTAAKLEAFSRDPNVKAVIFVQAVQGAADAFEKVRETRDDILLIAGVPGEEPQSISQAADIVFAADEINMGPQIVDKLAEWGCDVFVHYSFARHLGYESIANRLDIFREKCEQQGIELVERDAPDPASKGMDAASDFILEDVPAVMEEYAGKKVGFFTTNCGMQIALQRAVLEQPNAYYPLPCCPSPFHGFPDAFDIPVSQEDYAALDGYIGKLAEYLAQYDALGRFSTWAVPVNMSMVYGGFNYALKYINGETDGRLDEAVLEECLDEAAGAKAQLTCCEDEGGNPYENYFMIYFDNIDFNDYYSAK